MKKKLCVFLVMGLAASSTATIINIPADWPTIQQGIDASADGDTVLVQPGTYVENVNFNGHNIVLGSLFLTTGDTSYISSTIVDGNGGKVITFENNEGNLTELVGLTIQGGYSYNSDGAGIFCVSTSPVIRNNIIKNNTVYSLMASGAGIFTVIGNPIIVGNLIKDNSARGMLSRGGGIHCYGSQTIISNNVIVSNRAGDGGGILCGGSTRIIGNIIIGNYGDFAGGIYSTSGSPYITNNIIRDNPYSNSQIRPDSLDATFYNNIQGGYIGVGNIDVDPLFRNPASGDFHLMSIACGDSADSPCIDAGDPNILDSLLDCSWGLGGPRSDMGVYGGGDSLITSIFENIPSLPDRIMLFQNYPNPFNARTTIRFVLRQSHDVQLTVFDLLGRRVEVLIDEYMQAGVHIVNFDASYLSSGVYFCRLEAGDRIESKRMVLLK